MKFFLDTEFSERGPHYPIQLISLGLVREDGRSLYAESSEFDADRCNAWVKDNVLPKLIGPRYLLSRIRRDIISLVGLERPSFWGYYADYDWVVFCQIFGTMVDLPKGWPMYCNDIKQLCRAVGDPQLPVQEQAHEHHALFDALWNMKAYEFLMQYAEEKGIKLNG